MKTSYARQKTVLAAENTAATIASVEAKLDHLIALVGGKRDEGEPADEADQKPAPKKHSK